LKLGISRNLLWRVAVGIIAIPAIIYISLHHTLILSVFTALLSLLGAFELTRLMNGLRTGLIKLILPIASAGLMLSISSGWLMPAVSVFFAAIAIVTIVSSFTNNTTVLKEAVTETVFGLFYCGILFSSIPLIAFHEPDGGKWLVALLIIIWSSDTAAYFGGKATGKKKLAHHISPGKTIAGLWWGFAGAVLASLILGLTWIPRIELPFLLPLSIVLSGIGVVGDLFESALKRDAAVKDSSSIIPGHGGILDRFDSILFAAPTLYIFLLLRESLNRH